MANENDNNAKLAYEYTKLIWETTVTSYDAVTAKLTTAIGFSGLLLRFSADLSSNEWLCFLKLGACLALSVSIVSCCIGLWPRNSGRNLVPPDDFIDKEKGTWYAKDKSLSYLYISRGLNDETKRIRENRNFRLTCLNVAIASIGIASIGFAISIGNDPGIVEQLKHTRNQISSEIGQNFKAPDLQISNKTDQELTVLSSQP